MPHGSPSAITLFWAWLRSFLGLVACPAEFAFFVFLVKNKNPKEDELINNLVKLSSITTCLRKERMLARTHAADVSGRYSAAPRHAMRTPLLIHKQ